MLEIIYNGLGLASSVIVIIFIALFVILRIKKEDDESISKVWVIESLIMLPLNILALILNSILGKSIYMSVVCIVLWTIVAIFNFLSLISLKKKKRESIDRYRDFCDNVIYVDGIVQDIDEKEEKSSHIEQF